MQIYCVMVLTLSAFPVNSALSSDLNITGCHFKRLNKNVFSTTPDSSLVSQVAPFSVKSAFAGVCLWTAKLVHFGYYEARCVPSVRSLTEPSVLNRRCA